MKQLWMVLLTGCSVLIGCAAQNLPAADAPVASSQPAPTAGQAAVPAVVPPRQTVPDDYIIGPGDSLQIFVYQNPELTVTVPVRPDGKISSPLVENMVAVGKTPSQLARDVEIVLAEFVKAPKVNVIVDGAVSTFSQVKVVGQVRQPQALPFRQGLRVLDIVLASGGLTEFASPNRARIVREVNGKTIEQKVRLGDLLNKGELSQNFELKPGDVLIVPQSLF